MAASAAGVMLQGGAKDTQPAILGVGLSVPLVLIAGTKRTLSCTVGVRDRAGACQLCRPHCTHSHATACQRFCR